MEYTLGIDLGTSGVKAGTLNLASLKLDAVSAREVAAGPEQDPDVLWEKTLEAVSEALSLLGADRSIKAIGLSGQMHGAVLYDARGVLIAPVITWKDEKWSGGSVVEKMKQVVGQQTYPELGTDISSGYSGAVLFGIRESDPELFRRIAHFVLPTDFLRGKFLGRNRYATDPTNAFGTGLFNTKLSRWHAELIRTLQLPLDIFPEVHDSAQIAGEISADIARHLGLETGVPIVYGGGDNQMSMLGSGLVSPESPVLINIGTAAQISKVEARFRKLPGLDTRSFFGGNYAMVGVSLLGGGSFKWLRDSIREEGAADLDYSQLEELASRAPPGADGLIYCTGPTRQDPTRKRGFYGNLARAGSLGHKARAVMEGVLMDLYPAYERMSKADRSDFIVGAGKGLQNNRVWSQVAAGLLGKPLRITDFENAVFGAALMAAAGVGEIEGLGEALRSIEYTREIAPDPASVNFYRDEFVRYWRSQVSRL